MAVLGNPDGAVYGDADWTNWTDYWRAEDAEWLMSRVILRYASSGTRTTDLGGAPDFGRVTYQQDAERLEFRSAGAKWIPVIGAENLTVAPINASSGTQDVTVGHKAATPGGTGLAFGNTRMVATAPFDLSNKAYASSLKIDSAGGVAGGVAITTDATGLVVSDSLTVIGAGNKITVPELYVTGPATIANLTAPAITFSTLITAPSGVSLGAGTTNAADKAARKDYVDGLHTTAMNAAAAALTQAEADPIYLNKTAAETMTGWLVIRPTAQNLCLRLIGNTDSPLLEFYREAGTRQGYIQGTNTNLNIVHDTGDILLNSGGGQVRASDGVWMAGQVRAYVASGSTAALIGGGGNCYVGFYANGTNLDTIGTRGGWIGYTAADGYLKIVNENTNSSIKIITDYATSITSGGSEVCRFLNGEIMVGKTSAGLDFRGVEIYETGTIYLTRTDDAAALMYMNRGTGSSRLMIEFRRANVNIGEIIMSGTTGILYQSGCDHRMKEDRGPIIDAIAKVMQLHPHRALYHGDEERGVVDVFTAHELQAVVPDAVSGAYNGPEMQGGDYARVVPLLTAALQELITEVRGQRAAA